MKNLRTISLTLFLSVLLQVHIEATSLQWPKNQVSSAGGYYQQVSDSRQDPLPRIRTQSKTFRVPEGQNVELPCIVDNIGDHKVVWLRGRDVLSAGPILLTKDNRFRLQPASNGLELTNIRPQDAGDFVCQLQVVGEALEVTHTVEVLVPPRIRSAPEDGNIQVKKGTEVTLECSASGNPVPMITWSRENDNLPEGMMTGSNRNGYTIKKVDRFDAGRYTCTANNGVGPQATAHINLRVLYEPEIEVEAEKVHSGVGKEAHLTCIVHGEPKPAVKWYKENMELTPNSKIKMEEKDSTHRHTLIIRGLSSQHDFGNYSCIAENLLGTSKRHIEVHGRPTPAVFRYKPHQAYAGSKNSFRLTWTVDSYTNIEEYRLLYRQIKPYHPDDGNSLSMVTGSDWTNIIIPGDLGDTGFHHEKSFLLTDLVPDAQYECLVQAKNRYGWSEASRIHRFNTNPASYAQEQALDLGWKTSSSSSMTHLFNPFTCLVVASFARYLATVF